MDVLIRNVSKEDMAAIDLIAKDLGLSRNAYLKRMVHQVHDEGKRTISPEDWGDFSEECSDLGNEDIMRKAWY